MNEFHLLRFSIATFFQSQRQVMKEEARGGSLGTAPNPHGRQVCRPAPSLDPWETRLIWCQTFHLNIRKRGKCNWHGSEASHGTAGNHSANGLYQIVMRGLNAASKIPWAISLQSDL